MKLLLLFGFLQILILASGQHISHHDDFEFFKKKMQAFNMNSFNSGIDFGLPPRHQSHRHYNQRTHSQVKMPSGSSYIISKPKEAKYICTNKSDFVTMWPNDKKWKSEYMIVKKEMENTNKNIFLVYNILKIQKIFNPCLWRKYRHQRDQIYEETNTTNERMLFYGSGAARKLATHGFDERYARRMKGKFGAGMYFADHSSKSHIYTKMESDGTRQMLLCRVTLGKEHHKTSPQLFAHAPVGFQSVVGEMADTDYVIYRGEQAYPAYIITYKAN